MDATFRQNKTHSRFSLNATHVYTQAITKLYCQTHKLKPGVLDTHLDRLLITDIQRAYDPLKAFTHYHYTQVHTSPFSLSRSSTEALLRRQCFLHAYTRKHTQPTLKGSTLAIISRPMMLKTPHFSVLTK